MPKSFYTVSAFHVCPLDKLFFRMVSQSRFQRTGHWLLKNVKFFRNFVHFRIRTSSDVKFLYNCIKANIIVPLNGANNGA